MTNILYSYLETADPLEPVEAMVRIVAWLRPRKGEDTDAVLARMTELQEWLKVNTGCYRRLSGSLQEWLLEASYFGAFTALGILSRRGFGREFFDRLYEKINPRPADPLAIQDALALAFNHSDDPRWVSEIPAENWVQLLSMLWNYDREQSREIRLVAFREVLYAIEMLSIWVAAEELEVEIIRLDPKVISQDSAFVAQQREIHSFIRHYELWLQDEGVYYEDDHVRVLIEQCKDGLNQLRKRMVTRGSSVALTHLLERLNQTLARMELLLDTITVDNRKAAAENAIELFKQLVAASNQRNSLSGLWRQNSRLLARSITENASHHGEDYVTTTRKDYLRMFASGAGGGFIIAFMALIKIQIIDRDFPQFTETVLSSLNYGLGFVLIHMVGCTVATKQPAMTAAHFANAVERGDTGRANAEKLADLLIRVSRSQFAAIMGNVAIALALSFVLVRAYSHWQGAALIDTESARYLVHKLDMTASPALLHAAIAGVWLFVSGIIAGYFDNRATRIGLADRLGAHPLLTKLLPQSWRHKVATYIDDNYGALAGNFIFGVLLGSTGYIGYLAGLPLDIRHVAFSSADLGYSAATLSLDGGQWLMYGLCVLLIGGINLWVSFYLALSIALRSRGVRISSLGKLAKALWRKFISQPSAILFPPATPPADKEEDGEGEKATEKG